MAHSRFRQQPEHAVGHADARSKNGDQGEGFVEVPTVGHTDGRSDLGVPGLQFSADLVGHQTGDLVEKPSELGMRCVHVPGSGDLVLDERVLEHVQVLEVLMSDRHDLAPTCGLEIRSQAMRVRRRGYVWSSSRF